MLQSATSVTVRRHHGVPRADGVAVRGAGVVKPPLPGASIGSAARRALSFGGPPAAAARDDATASDATPAAAEGAPRFGSSAVAAAAAADYVSAQSLREKARSGALPVSIAALEVRSTARPSSWMPQLVGLVYCTTVGTRRNGTEGQIGKADSKLRIASGTCVVCHRV